MYFDIIDQAVIGAFFGMLLSLPVAPFLAFWMSAVKKRAAVVIGAIIGCVLGFLILDGWAGPLFFGKSMEGANGASMFFGGLLFCTTLGVVAGMVTDLLVARYSRRDYQRQHAHE